jgi:hypothetical protein
MADGLSMQLSLGNEAAQQLKTWRSDPRFYIRVRTADGCR